MAFGIILVWASGFLLLVSLIEVLKQHWLSPKLGDFRGTGEWAGIGKRQPPMSKGQMHLCSAAKCRFGLRKRQMQRALESQGSFIVVSSLTAN